MGGGKRHTSITWPMVALAVVLCVFVVAVLWIIPEGDAQSRATMLGVLVTVSGGAVAVFTRSKVNDVREDVKVVDGKVNGRMQQLIDETREARAALERVRIELADERARHREDR